MSKNCTDIDCEFTLALNNRTGKFFFCQDMIRATEGLIHSCYYGRFRSKHVPFGLLGRVLGRLARIEVNIRVKFPYLSSMFPKLSRSRPTLFTDPRECIFYNLKSSDIVLCHDMGPISHPQLYELGVHEIYKAAFREIQRAKPLMLFVSDASRTAFISYYGADYPALNVVHIPIRNGIEVGDEEAVDGIPEKFLLTVGSLGVRKNQVNSIRGYRASRLIDSGYAYVLCGGPEAGAEGVRLEANKTLGVIIPGYVNDRQLRWLYRKSSGFVLTSLLEGFGLPVAEAVAYGQIPIISPGGALEEVAGVGAIYADPQDPMSIASAMRSLICLSADERASRIAKLRSNISLFTNEAAVASWLKTVVAALANLRDC